jgi:hypothetical protein
MRARKARLEAHNKHIVDIQAGLLAKRQKKNQFPKPKVPYYNTGPNAMVGNKGKRKKGSNPSAGPSPGQSTLRNTFTRARSHVDDESSPPRKKTMSRKAWYERQQLREKYPRNNREQKQRAIGKLGKKLYLQLVSNTKDNSSDEESSDDESTPPREKTMSSKAWNERQRLRAKYPRNNREQKKRARRKLGEKLYLQLFSDTDDETSDD